MSRQSDDVSKADLGKSTLKKLRQDRIRTTVKSLAEDLRELAEDLKLGGWGEEPILSRVADYLEKAGEPLERGALPEPPEHKKLNPKFFDLVRADYKKMRAQKVPVQEAYERLMLKYERDETAVRNAITRR